MFETYARNFSTAITEAISFSQNIKLAFSKLTFSVRFGRVRNLIFELGVIFATLLNIDNAKCQYQKYRYSS